MLYGGLSTHGWCMYYVLQSRSGIDRTWLANNQSRDLNNEFWLVIYVFRSVAGHYLKILFLPIIFCPKRYRFGRLPTFVKSLMSVATDLSISGSDTKIKGLLPTQNKIFLPCSSVHFRNRSRNAFLALYSLRVGSLPWIGEIIGTIGISLFNNWEYI